MGDVEKNPSNWNVSTRGSQAAFRNGKMSKSLESKLAKQSLYEIGYDYLRKNFHRFKEENKIKVAISILQIFNKDGSKSFVPNQNLVLIFGKDVDKNEIEDRLQLMTGQRQLNEVST